MKPIVNLSTMAPNPFQVLHIEPDNDRIIVIDSLSKRFSLCGSRIGGLITCNQEVLRTSLHLAQARLCSPTIGQHAAAHMLQNISPNYVASIRQEFEKRRNTLHCTLKKIPGVKSSKPQGAFYAIAQLPVNDSERFAGYLLREFHDNQETVFVAPSNGFFMTNGRGVNKVRIAYVLDSKDISRAVEIIGKGLESYQE